MLFMHSCPIEWPNKDAAANRSERPSAILQMHGVLPSEGSVWVPPSRSPAYVLEAHYRVDFVEK